MKKYKFILNGEVKELSAKNLLSALANISRAFPEVKKLDYRVLKVTEF